MVERLWRKTRLHVHLLHLKDLLVSFNTSVQDARAAYFSDYVSKIRGNPKVLFNTISDIVAPAPPAVPISSNEDCEKFISFFVEKVSNMRNKISPSVSLLSAPIQARRIILERFLPVFLPELVN